MNKKILVCIGFLMLFTLAFCNEDHGLGWGSKEIGQNTPNKVLNVTFEQN